MASDWTTTYCIQEEGFPQVLYATTVRLGISDCPEYVCREYVEDGTEYCEVTVHIGASGRFPEMGPWSVTFTGTHLSDTYQLVAHKALKCLYQMCKLHMVPTPVKYFPPLDCSRPAWEARVHTLEGLGPQEEDPTIMTMVSYLLALDSLCDQQCAQARSMIGHAELSEHRWCKSRVELAKYEARAIHAESRVMALEDELSNQADRNSTDSLW
jgi:hypothetical protein